MLLIRNALLLRPDPAADPRSSEAVRVVRDGWFTVEAHRIVETGSGDAPAAASGDEVIDAGGAFVAPGFVSSHSHLFTSGLRGLGVDATLYGWCDEMLGMLHDASPDDVYWCTLHGALDFLSNGVTTAFDFTDPRLPWEPMVDGAREGGGELRPLAWATKQADAKLDAGLRFVHAQPMDDTVGTDDEIVARLGEVVDHLRAMDGDRMLRPAVSGSVQWSPREDAALLEARAMREFGLLNQAHFLETREEIELQRSKFARYVEAGVLGPDMIFGHFIQTTPEIIAQAAEGGAGMSWQPVSNGRLASGTADIPAIRAAGMRIGVGLDDQACTDLSDPWQSLRTGINALRAESGDPLVMGPAEMLWLHTVGSARILGVDDRVGALEPGMLADFVVVDPRSPDIGPLWNPVASYVLACGPRNLKAVYVGGVVVSEDGVSTNPLAASASENLHDVLGRLGAARGYVL